MPKAGTGSGGRVAADYGNPDPEWLKIDWREHLRRVELPGAEVGYVEIGAGEPILFIHGLSGSWQNWLENLPHFGRGRRAIALDLPGFGSSPTPDWPIDIPAYGRLVRDFCEKLDLSRETPLVGNSLGGLVALEAQTMSPDTFGPLVLVSSAGLINTWSPEQRASAIAWAWRAFGPPVADGAKWLVCRPRTRRFFWRSFVRYPEKLRPELLWEQMNGGLRGPAFTDVLRAAIRFDLRDRLGAIEAPTMIVWGFDDRVIPVQASLSLHRRIPVSRLEIFERTGHIPQLERPARFNALLDDFLG
ncbi:MAG TPA: alpha/beta fold hydrolase [Solirubrobacterales bacterium]